MHHTLKIKETYYYAVISGRKTFEIRKNDRNYKVGDTISFIVISDDGTCAADENNIFEITYVFYGGKYGLDKDYCVFSLARFRYR